MDDEKITIIINKSTIMEECPLGLQEQIILMYSNISLLPYNYRVLNIKAK